MTSEEIFNGIQSRLTPEVRAILEFDGQLETETRISTGAYYTPLEMALTMALDAQFTFLGEPVPPHDRGLSSDQITSLAQCHWLDMACGTGVFALAHLLALEALAHKSNDLKAEALMDIRDLLRTASSNMVLSDLNQEALARARDLIALVVPTPFEPQFQCFHLDTLTDLHLVPQVAKIIDEGGFDIIIGNPPYLGERGNKAIFQHYRSLPHLSPYYEGKMDLFYFFIQVGISWLRPRGVLTQITTHYFTTADGAKKLRAALKDQVDIRILHPLHQSDLFKDVKSLCFLSFTLSKRVADCPKGSERSKALLRHETHCQWVNQRDLFDSHGQLLLTVENNLILDKVNKFQTVPLQTLLEINQGVVSGADRVRPSHQLDVENGPIFVFDHQELMDLLGNEEMPSFFKPFVKNSFIKPFQVQLKDQKWLLYSDSPLFLESDRWLAHLKQFEVVLKKRREVVTGAKQWYQLQWGRGAHIFERPKILVPQRAKRNQFAFVPQPLYGSADVYFLGKDSLDVEHLKAYTAYLNSPLVHLWLYTYGKRKGALLELYATPLGRIPVPIFNPDEIATLAALHDQCATFGDQGSELELHHYLSSYFSLTDEMEGWLWEWHTRPL